MITIYYEIITKKKKEKDDCYKNKIIQINNLGEKKSVNSRASSTRRLAVASTDDGMPIQRINMQIHCPDPSDIKRHDIRLGNFLIAPRKNLVIVNNRLIMLKRLEAPTASRG